MPAAVRYILYFVWRDCLMRWMSTTLTKIGEMVVLVNAAASFKIVRRQLRV
jgi:hypothetical protein